MILLSIIYTLIGIGFSTLVLSFISINNEFSDSVNFPIEFLLGMFLAAIILWPIAIIVIFCEFISSSFVEIFHIKKSD